MFTIIKGNYINLGNVTYYSKEDVDIIINFAGASDNYVRIECDSKREVEMIMLKMCNGHIGHID